MARRTALVTAGALTIVVIAAIAAVAANLGLLRLAGDTGPVGRLAPTDLAPAAVVERPGTPAGATPLTGQDGGSEAVAGHAAGGGRHDDSGFEDPALAGQRGVEHQFGGRQDDD